MVVCYAFLPSDKAEPIESLKERHKVSEWKQNDDWAGIVESYMEMSAQLSQGMSP